MVPGTCRHVGADIRVEPRILHPGIGQVVVEPPTFGQLRLRQPEIPASSLFVEACNAQSHRGLDVVPGIAVPALEPRDHPVGALDRSNGLGGGENLVCRQDPGKFGDPARPRPYRCSSVLGPDIETCAADRVDLKGLVGCRHAGFLA